MKTLEDLRKEIDSADDELLSALAKRFSIIREIGLLKKNNNIKPLDTKRWDEVLQKMTSKAKKLNISEELIHKIYEEIHKASLIIEKDHE
jgi:chorismate mutase